MFKVKNLFFGIVLSLFLTPLDLLVTLRVANVEVQKRLLTVFSLAQVKFQDVVIPSNNRAANLRA